jgi:hypothetical protein
LRVRHVRARSLRHNCLGESHRGIYAGDCSSLIIGPSHRNGPGLGHLLPGLRRSFLSFLVVGDVLVKCTQILFSIDVLGCLLHLFFLALFAQMRVHSFLRETRKAPLTSVVRDFTRFWLLRFLLLG